MQMFYIVRSQLYGRPSESLSRNVFLHILLVFDVHVVALQLIASLISPTAAHRCFRTVKIAVLLRSRDPSAIFMTFLQQHLPNRSAYCWLSKNNVLEAHFMMVTGFSWPANKHLFRYFIIAKQNSMTVGCR